MAKKKMKTDETELNPSASTSPEKQTSTDKVEDDSAGLSSVESTSNVVTDAINDVQVNETVKRRGRPKGSKNKTETKEGGDSDKIQIPVDVVSHLTSGLLMIGEGLTKIPFSSQADKKLKGQLDNSVAVCMEAYGSKSINSKHLPLIYLGFSLSVFSIDVIMKWKKAKNTEQPTEDKQKEDEKTEDAERPSMLHNQFG